MSKILDGVNGPESLIPCLAQREVNWFNESIEFVCYLDKNRLAGFLRLDYRLPSSSKNVKGTPKLVANLSITLIRRKGF